MEFQDFLHSIFKAARTMRLKNETNSILMTILILLEQKELLALYFIKGLYTLSLTMYMSHCYGYMSAIFLKD